MGKEIQEFVFDGTETSVMKYHYTLCNIPEGLRSQLYRSGSIREAENGTSTENLSVTNKGVD
jgi:hypothetical protein